MLEIIKEASDNVIPQMTIVGNKNAPLTKKSNSKITGTAIPFELAHPRYPKNAANGKGGEFMEKGSNDYKMAVANSLVQAVKQKKMSLESAQKAAKDLGVAKNSPQKNNLSERINQVFSVFKSAISSAKNQLNSIVSNLNQPKENKAKKLFDLNDLAKMPENKLNALQSQAKNNLKNAKDKYYAALKQGKTNSVKLAELNKQIKSAQNELDLINKQLKPKTKQTPLMQNNNDLKINLNDIVESKWSDIKNNKKKTQQYLQSLEPISIEDKKNNFIRTLKSNLGNEVHPASTWLNPKDINPDAPPPTIQQVRDIYAYTGTSTCQSMNGTLRGLIRDADVAPLAIQMAERTSDALNTLPDYKGTVYRGTGIPLDMAKQLKVGAMYSDPAFLSTSTDLEVATKFVRKNRDPRSVQMIFQIEGAHQGKDIDKISAFKGQEKEILFDANSQFRITKISNHQGYPVVHLEQIKSTKIPLSKIAEQSKRSLENRKKLLTS